MDIHSAVSASCGSDLGRITATPLRTRSVERCARGEVRDAAYPSGLLVERQKAGGRIALDLGDALAGEDVARVYRETPVRTVWGR